MCYRARKPVAGKCRVEENVVLPQRWVLREGVAEAMARYVVGRVAEVPPGQRKIVDVNGRSIGVFNVHGKYYALLSRCPHQGAPLCLGKVNGMTMPSKPGEYIWGRDGEILRCPWHGWEFDLTNGRSIFNPHRVRVKAYDVAVEPEDPSVETFPVAVERGLIVLYTSPRRGEESAADEA
jgi:nitrite reductase/ring-hydroxylating ferredoxin subunit